MTDVIGALWLVFAGDASDASSNNPERVARTVSTANVSLSELVQQLRHGRQEALSALYVALRIPVWRLAMLLVHSADIADEIVQNVFLALWLRRETLAPDTDIQAYLNTAVRNEVRKLGRHARVVTGVEHAVERAALDLPAHGASSPDPAAAAERKEFFQAYQQALTTLTDRERVALRVRWEADGTFEEVGRTLGLSKVGARTVVLRAEEKVRALLARYRAT